ncbi:MAG: bacteriohemerythrin [Magnetococcales bacterium]|nr:bacteriohemerythrin [Magnetococcales bacterium]
MEEIEILVSEAEALRKGHEEAAKMIGQHLIRERQEDEWILLGIVLTLAWIGLTAGRRILRLIINEVDKRLVAERELSQSQLMTQKQQVEMSALQRSNRAIIMSLADLAEKRDSNTGEHVLRVARVTQKIALKLREDNTAAISDIFLEQIALCSMLHDVGKVSIPDRILLKPGPLTPEERRIMQEHSAAGCTYLKNAKDLQEVDSYLEMATRIARSHHEQYQGGGYPDGLAGEDIPLEARIVMVADVYDALTSWRPYKEPWSEEKALAFIRNESGKSFDPKVVAAFLEVIAHHKELPVITWTREMSVGVPDLDNDHKGIIRLINEIDIVQKRFDSITVELVLYELFNYTIRHFQREETFLRDNGFPATLILDHAGQHNHFAGRVTELRRRYIHEKQPDIVSELTALMSKWLVNHIMIEDMKYAKQDGLKANSDRQAGSVQVSTG